MGDVIAGATDEEWDRFAWRTGSMFATREWIGCWRDTEPGADRVEGLLHRDARGALDGALLLMPARHPFGAALPFGPWPGPAASVLSSPEDRAAVTPALLDAARRSDRRRSLRLLVPAEDEPMPGDGATPVGGTVPNRSFVLAGTDWDSLLDRSGRNSRKAYRRRTRRLHERYAVRHRISDDPAALETDVDLLLRLHQRRWADEPAVFGPERRAFLQAFVAAAAARGWIVLQFLELDGTAVAAQLSVRFAGAEFALISAADPALRDEQVGIELLFRTVQGSIEAGMRELHLLPGDEEVKRRLPGVDRPLQEVVVPLSGAAAVVARGRRSAARMLRRGART